MQQQHMQFQQQQQYQYHQQLQQEQQMQQQQLRQQPPISATPGGSNALVTFQGTRPGTNGAYDAPFTSA
jgi:hypothetical protein